METYDLIDALILVYPDQYIFTRVQRELDSFFNPY